MLRLFEQLIGGAAKPLRRDLKLRIRNEPDGDPAIQPILGGVFALGANRSVDRIEVEADSFYSCGCTTERPIGGECGEPGCKRVSCRSCFGRCRCGKPLCLQHSGYIDTDMRRRECVCGSCYIELAAKQAALGLLRSLRRGIEADTR